MLQYAFCILMDQSALNDSEIQGMLPTSQPSRVTAGACELPATIFLPTLCAGCLKSHLCGKWGKTRGSRLTEHLQTKFCLKQRLVLSGFKSSIQSNHWRDGFTVVKQQQFRKCFQYISVNLEHPSVCLSFEQLVIYTVLEDKSREKRIS